MGLLAGVPSQAIFIWAIFPGKFLQAMIDFSIQYLPSVKRTAEDNLKMERK